MKTRRLHRHQGGFSLIELLIVIALTGLITAAITTTIFQVFNMNTRTANRMTAISQVQQAGKLVSEDVLEAVVVNVAEGSGFPLTLTCTYYEESVPVSHQIEYSLDEGELWRSESVNATEPATMSLVAEHIDASQTSFAPPGGKLGLDETLTFTVTATVGDESETRVYEVKPRPGT